MLSNLCLVRPTIPDLFSEKIAMALTHTVSEETSSKNEPLMNKTFTHLLPYFEDKL